MTNLQVILETISRVKTASELYDIAVAIAGNCDNCAYKNMGCYNAGREEDGDPCAEGCIEFMNKEYEGE